MNTSILESSVSGFTNLQMILAARRMVKTLPVRLNAVEETIHDILGETAHESFCFPLYINALV